MLYGTDNFSQDILGNFHIQIECGEYSVEYCQSHGTLLWISMMLWRCMFVDLLIE